MKNIAKAVAGWTGVGVTVVFSGLWAYWGAVENIHEGWYSVSVRENLFMLFFQYLLIAIVFTFLALFSLKWKKAGLVLHIALAVFCVWFFSGASFSVLGFMIVIPIAGLGLLYFFGDPVPKKLAYGLIVFVPLVIILSVSVPQGIRVSRRIDDGDFGTRIVEGSGMTLAWAPRGPGWPDKGTTWEEAREICRHLSEDGTEVLAEEQNIWRLPSVAEAVGSMMLHGEKAGGFWDETAGKAVYEKTPDKESPLWDVHSQVIYYWTAETSPDDEQRAYIIVYHGGVFDRRKTDGQSYLSFRAVRDPGMMPEGIKTGGTS